MIMKEALVFMKGKKGNGIYLLQGSTIIGAVAVSSLEVSDLIPFSYRVHLGYMTKRGMTVSSKQVSFVARK